jgi:hypothetical protein
MRSPCRYTLVGAVAVLNERFRRTFLYRGPRESHPLIMNCQTFYEVFHTSDPTAPRWLRHRCLRDDPGGYKGQSRRGNFEMKFDLYSSIRQVDTPTCERRRRGVVEKEANVDRPPGLVTTRDRTTTRQVKVWSSLSTFKRQKNVVRKMIVMRGVSKVLSVN